MGLRDRLRQLQKRAEGEMVSIPQQDGTVKRFPTHQFAEAFLSALDRACGTADPEEPEHPLSLAARNSSDPKWRNSAYWADLAEHPPEDLSE